LAINETYILYFLPPSPKNVPAPLVSERDSNCVDSGSSLAGNFIENRLLYASYYTVSFNFQRQAVHKDPFLISEIVHIRF